MFFLILFCIACKGEIIDYCKFIMDGEVHSTCNNTCFPTTDNHIMNPDFQFRVDMLDGHNFYRNYLAGGGNTSGGNSQSSNMMALSYDMRLEFTVACWIYTHGLMEHDVSRGTPKFPEAGQNLWEGNKAAAIPIKKDDLMHVLWRWYRELQWTKGNWIDAYPQSAERQRVWTKEGTGPFHIGHYTQLVWAETTHVGCARCYRENMGKFLVGCNYGEGGNVISLPVYKRGPPASACPQGKKANKDYPNLCGEIEPLPKDVHYEGIPEMEERWDKLYKNHPDYPKYRKILRPGSSVIPKFLITTTPGRRRTKAQGHTTKTSRKFKRGMATKWRINNILLVSLCLGLLLTQHNSLGAKI